MVAQIDDDLPLPVRVVLDQEQDEDCHIYLDYDELDATTEYTSGRIIAVSTRTTAEYTITDDFDIPEHNIRDVVSDDLTETRVRLQACDTDDLQTLFNLVTIEYSLTGAESETIQDDTLSESGS